MPLHIPVARARVLDVNVITGTSGDASSPAWTVEELIPEMTHTLTAEAGDELIIHFGCSVVSTGSIPDDCTIVYRIKVGGVTIDPDKSIHTGSSDYIGLGADIVRTYVIPADGDYTITVTWQDNSAGDEGFINSGNRRQMIIQHFH